MMQSIFFITLYFLPTIWAQHSHPIVEIPGCPDINMLSETANDLEGEKLDQIKCVCASDMNSQEEKNAGIEVNCVFGASFENLASVLDSISNLNRTVKQVLPIFVCFL